jgi:hypothetical protein
MEEYDTNVNESPPGQQRSQTTVSTLTTSNTVRTSNQEDELEGNVDFTDGGQGGFDDNDNGGDEGEEVLPPLRSFLSFPMFV